MSGLIGLIGDYGSDEEDLEVDKSEDIVVEDEKITETIDPVLEQVIEETMVSNEETASSPINASTSEPIPIIVVNEVQDVDSQPLSDRIHRMAKVLAFSPLMPIATPLIPGYFAIR